MIIADLSYTNPHHPVKGKRKKSEDRSQRSEVRSQKSEVRSQNPSANEDAVLTSDL
jgi:hypothetical protein